MASATKYQIFISSTFEDLKAERDAVIKAILEMGHIPVGMEMFSAADEEQWRIIQRYIDESDYYVVLVAHRYGSLTEGISYTRKEYEYAAKSKVPILGFLIDPSASWPADRVDKDTKTKKLLDDFKALVAAKPVGWWKNAEDLHSKSVLALIKAFSASPREGWVRSSSAVGPEVAAELTRLSAENARLRDRLKAAEEDAVADRDKALQRRAEILEKQSRRISYRYHDERIWQVDAEPRTLFEIFELLGPSMIPEYPLNKCSSLLAFHLKVDEARTADIVPVNVMKDLLADFLSLEVMEPSRLKHSVKDDQEYWSLTEEGVELMKWAKRRALESPTVASETEVMVSEEQPDGASGAEGAP